MVVLNYQQQYLKTKVETASQGELTLLLYEELYRKLNMAKMHWSKEQYTEMMERIHGARAILYEMLGTLNFNYDISRQLRDLYQYYLTQLNMFVINKDPKLLEQVLDFAREFAQTWKEAVHIAKSDKRG